MAPAPSIVHVIVAPDYGERLRGLPADEAAWVADTPTNHSIIKSISVTPRIRAQLESRGFVKFEDLPDGFGAHKLVG